MASPDPLVTRARALLTAAYPDAVNWSRIGFIRASGGGPGLRLRWIGGPSEARITSLLEPLAVPLRLDRRPLWSCGNLHPDAEDAYIDHVLTDRKAVYYSTGDRRVLLRPHVREDILAAHGGEFPIPCRPGNYALCRWCDGSGGWYDLKTLNRVDCPHCGDLTSRAGTGGVFDLDDPVQNAAFETAYDAAAKQAAKIEAKERALHPDRSVPVPAAPAPNWVRLADRAAGYAAGLPVPVTMHCDVLTYLAAPNQTRCCSRAAVWFDTHTGIRACGQHKNQTA